MFNLFSESTVHTKYQVSLLFHTPFTYNTLSVSSLQVDPSEPHAHSADEPWRGGDQGHEGRCDRRHLQRNLRYRWLQWEGHPG